MSLLSAVFFPYACFVLSFFIFSFFLLILPRISQAIAVLPVSWAFCENCLSARVFYRGRVFSQHDSGNTAMGTPCFLRGARRSDGLFWVLFLAAAKKCLARGANTAMPK